MRNRQKKKSKSKHLPQRINWKKIVGYIGIAASIATILQFIMDISDPAEDTYNNVLNNTKDSVINQVMVKQGNVYINLNDTKVEQIDPEQNTSNASAEQQIAYSYDLIQQGDYELAEKELQTFIDRGNAGPMDMAILHYNLGVVYYYQKKYALAKTEFETAVKTAGFADAYYFLGIISGSVFDDYPEAIVAFTNALKYEIKPEYLLARAWAYENNDQYQEAQEDYETILAIY